MFSEILLFLLAGLVGGAVNAAAGGAKLFVFPMLLASGLPPLAANATGTVAIWPGFIPAMWVLRDRLEASRSELLLAVAPGLLGALVGAVTLITAGERVFVAVIPFFLILAVAAIALGKRLTRYAEKIMPDGPARRVALVLLLFAAGFYAGFFGAGLGFMLLAVLTLAGARDIHVANARKNLFALLFNTTAVVPLALSGLVNWPAAITVLIGAFAGGYGGARLTRGLPEQPVRYAVAGVGLVLTLTFLFG
ncbi:MAG: sulfite exporter TauE/SafE family protein [Geminicoccaceae bacterium]